LAADAIAFCDIALDILFANDLVEIIMGLKGNYQ
jgi:hypothetical protein